MTNPLNPEAGYVSIPDDPREVDAALRAGRVTYRIFPYYAWRYGERGERFTRSDSAWLARLRRYEPPHIRNQVTWLASVLSNRGMPSYLLEVHLRVLSKALSRAVPERAGPYEKLVAAADGLREARLSRFGEADFREMPGAFADRLGPVGPRRLLRGAGLLVVAAVADERAGIPGAVGSLLEWLGDAGALRKAPGLVDALGAGGRAALDPGGAARWAASVYDLVDEARSRPYPVPTG
ncbi:hypothetical protein [Tautonia plasticadhaerens]|uniref:Uncharacterized protein n=1 Tax=Tautonia plasticadhaerens TaxID=2527974 RepID=A0A518H1S8_9BACT|nr:hypothetical protein [Tautonia plasticadhaerens]QDV34791.1 hypothetical protein ElP_26870 [Tautonia plasticadhaerens]